jgi:hypothetical protein
MSNRGNVLLFSKYLNRVRKSYTYNQITQVYKANFT